MKGHLLVSDLAFFSYRLLDRIERNDGFFLTRLESNAGPLVVGNDRLWRGRALDVVGRPIREVPGRIQPKVLDVQVRMGFRRRRCDGRVCRASRLFRVVAIGNDDTGRYYAYLTNVSLFDLSPEELARICSLRWQVELLLKCLRTRGHLDHLRSSNRHVVEALVWASALAGSALLLTPRHGRRRRLEPHVLYEAPDPNPEPQG